MKRFLTVALPVLVVLFALPGCGGGDELSRMTRAVGVDLSAGTLVEFEDTHGGFHGDGHTTAVVELGGLEEELAGAPGWKPLPMSENAEQALRLCWKEAVLPGEGFYYLYDRHSQSDDPYDDTALHSRASWNFTIAVYDSQSGWLYYYQLDT